MNLSFRLGALVFPALTWRREVSDGTVHLTFDDGPHPEITPWVMDQLEPFGFKATFFMVGDNAVLYPEIVKEVITRGHAIGNHTQHHIKGWKTGANDYLSDIEDCAANLPDTQLFRPPYGQINVKAARKMNNYEIIMWDVLSRDYLKGLAVPRNLKRIQSQTRPGSIIVFHDSSKAWTNLEQMLPPYLEFLQQGGFKSEIL